MLKRAFITIILSVLPLGICYAQAPGDLDQELEFLQPEENRSQQNDTQPASTDRSPMDTLSEGLESLFSKEKEEATNPTETSASPGAPSGHFTQYALLQGLNKITARTSSLNVAMNDPITFGTLEITVHKCWKAAPEEAQENKALMEIWEKKPGEDKSRIFYGWMFSSTPSISALESAIYDVTVIECSDNKPEE